MRRNGRRFCKCRVEVCTQHSAFCAKLQLPQLLAATNFSPYLAVINKAYQVGADQADQVVYRSGMSPKNNESRRDKPIMDDSCPVGSNQHCKWLLTNLQERQQIYIIPAKVLNFTEKVANLHYSCQSFKLHRKGSKFTLFLPKSVKISSWLTTNSYFVSPKSSSRARGIYKYTHV